VASIGDFEHVLAAAQQGADWAWAAIYDEFAPGLLRFITSQGASDPSDCLGECFVQVVRNLPGFTGDEAAFRAWLFLLARNRVVDEWRSARRRPSTPTEDVAQLHDARHQAPPADATLGQGQSAEDILGALKPDQRAVISLRVLDGFSVEETARILGKSAGAVRVIQHRAIKQLKARLGG
jgi:RNA polymerase sigma factor, sigma-70 family